MEVTTNYINKYTNIKNSALPNLQQGKVISVDNPISNSNLPSVYPIGQSQLNSNLPISYTKIAEIPIPGVKDPASIFKLANGQKVAILPKKGPTYIKTTYNVGSMNETENIRGMSHYIEHNLFNGSKNLAPQEYDKKVAELGGSTNASTSFNKTDYFLSLQLLEDNSLEEAIKLNAEQTQFPTFPQDQLIKEKEPVKSEIDMYLDSGYDVASCNVLKNLFGINTNSTNFIIGTKENINSFTRDDVFDYFNTWYTPDNAVTVITGDVDVDQTINLVSKYYNKQNDYSKIHQRRNEPIKYIDKTVRNDIIMPNSMSSSIVMGFALPEGMSKEELTQIETLQAILMSNNSSLSKALDKYGVFADFYTEEMQNNPNGAKAFICNAIVNENQIEDVLKVLYQEITNIANNPPSQQELDSIKRKTIFSINNMSEESSSANSLLTNILKNNDFNYINEEINRVSALTPQDISNAAKKFLDLNKTAICVAHSKEATPESINNNYKTSNTTSSYNVSFGSSAKIKDSINADIQQVQQFKLYNNIETKIIPFSQTDKSSVVISLESDELSNFSQPTFDVLNILLNRGNLYKDNDTVLNLKDSKDYSYSFDCFSKGIDICSSFHSQDINEVLSLIKETLLSPNFSQAEFERAKTLIKDSILSENKSSMDNLYHELFNGVKKYNSKEQRLLEIDSLTLNDVQNLYYTIMQTSQVKASMNTPINQNQILKDIFNTSLSVGLPVFRPVTIQQYNTYKPITQEKTIVDAEECSQASITQAYTYKFSDNIDDIAKITLLNTILGEGMSSRLFTDLRGNEKLAYSVHSGISSEKDTGLIYLTIGTTTESPDPNEGSPANITKSIEGFNRNVNLLRTTNVSPKELNDAKTALKTEILNNLETGSEKLADFHSSSNSIYGLNYNTALLDAIDKITVDDIRNTANYVFQNPPVTSIVASQKTLDTLGLK